MSKHTSWPLRIGRNAGVTLIELMIAVTISLVLLLALVTIFVNLARANDELAKTNSLIENGRFALQILENDVVHAGFWGGYLPQFDDLAATAVPGDVPTLVPNPCLAYSSWTSAYRSSLVGMPLVASDTLWSGSGCVSPLTQRAGTDVLVVRHADMCVPGDANCAAAVTGRLYFQNSFCSAEKNAGTALGGTANTITLGSSASATNGAYVGVMLHITAGAGAGQYRWISGYAGSTRIATVNTAWAVTPNGTSQYAFEYTLGRTSFPLYQRDCVGTGSPASLPISSGTVAERRRLITNVYYIADMTHPDKPGEVVPTLVRSQLDLVSGSIVQGTPAALIDGIEAFRVELGIDDVSKTGAAVNYSQAVNWNDPATMTTPTNRGDGMPDRYVHCDASTPCTAADLTNVVAAKLWVLARSRDTSNGYVDTKSYCLGSPDPLSGACPQSIAAANDHYKRHVFATSVRIVNVSGRRETPFP